MEKSFNVFLPIDKVSKSDDKDSNVYIISGMASTADKDLQGETIDPSGIDASYLIHDGYVDFEHDHDQVIGVPTENTHVDSKGLFVEAKLFKNMPQVQDIIKLYHNIKDNGIKRSLGFSIEGNVIERDMSDDSIIRQVQITGVAVTKNPANTHATWELLSKSIFNANTSKEKTDSEKTTKMNPLVSMTVKLNNNKHVNKALIAGTDITPENLTDGGAFRAESLSGQLVSFAENLKEAREIGLTPIANSVADLLAKGDSIDDEVMTLFLQLFEGLSYTDSLAVVHAINSNKLTESRLERLLGGADGVTDDDDN